MRVKGSFNPPPFTFEVIDNGNTALMRFYENVKPFSEKTDDSETETQGWEYDRFTITLPNAQGLLARVESDVAGWLRYAKNVERDELASQVRAERNRLLAQTDSTQLLDSPLSLDTREAFADYRQALRDVPQQAGFPFVVEFPDPPETR